MIKKILPLSAVLLVTALPSQSAGLPVASLNRKTPVDFQDEILPMFRANCLACHNQTKSKADVNLETPAKIAEADIVVPGKPMESLLFLSSAHLEDPAMPPKENKASGKDLNPQELALLKLWIEQGAKGEIRSARKVEWQPLPSGLNPIYAVSVSPDGQYAAAGRANQIFIYHIPSKSLVTRLTDPDLLKGGKYKEGVSHKDLVHSLAFNPTGDLLASGGYREVKLWRRLPIVAAKSFTLGTDKGIHAVSPDGKWLAAAEGNVIKVYDVAKGNGFKGLSGLKGTATSVAFSPDGARIAAGAEDGGLLVWNVADGKSFTIDPPVPPKEGEKAPVVTPIKINAVTFAAGGKQLAVAQENNLITIYNVTDKLVAAGELKGHSAPVTALAPLSSAPTQLISGAGDSTLRHWDINGFKMVRQIAAGGVIAAVAASPDGKRFACVLKDKNARLFNAADGKLIADLKGSHKAIEDSASKDRFAAYAKAEVAYYTTNLKTKTDNHKKADDRVKKAGEALKKAEAMPIAEKKKVFDEAEVAKKSGEEKYNKLKADYDAILKTFGEQDKVAKVAEAATKKAVDAAKAPMVDFTSKDKVAKTKMASAVAAKKKLDNLIQTQVKPAENKAATAKTAVGAVTAAKAAADKGLAVAKTAVAEKLKKFTAAENAAKAAEENSKKVAGDSNKTPEEKQAATKAANEKRNAANSAKTELTQAQAKEKSAGTAAATAANKLTQSQAAQKAADAAVITVKGRVAAAQRAFDTANQAAATAAKTATSAKPAADKAKATADAATKMSTEKRKLASETQKKRDELNKQQAAAKKALDEAAKKATAAEGEYKKLEEPRQQAANEAKLSKEALVKTEVAKKEAEGQKAVADKQQADADGAAKLAKDALAKVNSATSAIVFSSNSKRLFTGSADKIIHVWNTDDGKQVNSVSGHKEAVNGLGMTPSGHLISVSADKTATLWTLTDEWKLERTLGSGGVDSPIVDRATALSFSYDGKQLAAGSGEPSRSGTVHVFNIADGKVTKNLLEVHSDTVMGLQFNSEGTQIASGGADKFAKITNLGDGKILHSFEGHTHHVLGVAWQYNGRVLASVGADNEIKVWNVVTGERAGKFGVGGKEVTSIQFVGYTDNAVVTAGDNRVRRVSIPMGNPKNIRDFSGAKDYVYSGSASADGNIIAAGGADAILRIWNGASGASIVTFEAPKVQ